MLNGIHGHQDIERVVYGKPAGAALRAEAERLGARRVFITTTKSVAQSALLADVIKELAGDRAVRRRVLVAEEEVGELPFDVLLPGGGRCVGRLRHLGLAQ